MGNMLADNNNRLIDAIVHMGGACKPTDTLKPCLLVSRFNSTLNDVRVKRICLSLTYKSEARYTCLRTSRLKRLSLQTILALGLRGLAYDT